MTARHVGAALFSVELHGTEATFALEKCSGLFRNRTTVFQRGCAGPALEGAIERAGVRVAEHESNLGKIVLFFFNVLECQTAPCIVDQLLEVHTVLFELSL